MAAITKEMQWLSRLKASQLHKLAVTLGSPCSGSKGIVADGIRQALISTPLENFQLSSKSHSISQDPGHHFSIVSIDMGIQNLAYAHLLAPQPSGRVLTDAQGAGVTKLPLLNAWERLAAFPVENQDNSKGKSAKSGSYDPSKYASAAHQFITKMITKYDPTHILIEQQRFRSGGSSAVAEWTIRVGVFEGMLHAILRTLQVERRDKFKLQAVVSINPARTARFWLEGSGRNEDLLEPRRIIGREGKQAKIDMVAKSFLSSKDHLVRTGVGQAKAMETAFLERWCSTSKAAKAPRAIEASKAQKVATSTGHEISEPKQPKLDDLADCLLQALAWLEWQRMRELILHDTNAEHPVAAIEQQLESMAF